MGWCRRGSWSGSILQLKWPKLAAALSWLQRSGSIAVHNAVKRHTTIDNPKCLCLGDTGMWRWDGAAGTVGLGSTLQLKWPKVAVAGSK